MSLLGGRRLERWISEREERFPSAARYLRAFVTGLTAKAEAERQIEVYQERYFLVIDQTISTIAALFGELVPEEGIDPENIEAILESLSSKVGAMPHEEQFDDFDDVVHAFYDRPAYPMLEHLMYLNALGIERLNQVLTLAAEAALGDTIALADLGVGPAAIFRALLEEHPGWTGSGFDVSAHCVRYADQALRRAGLPPERFELVEADARALPREDGTFDLVVATEILEHVPDPDALLTEIARVIKPGGAAIVSAPTNLPWGPHLSVFETAEEIQALYRRHFELIRLSAVPIQRNAQMTFALLQKSAQ